MLPRRDLVIFGALRSTPDHQLYPAFNWGKVYLPAQICRVIRVRSTGACAGIFSNNVLLVITDIILKRVANYIYIPIYSTISRIPTTLRHSPLLQVSEKGRAEIITTDQSDAAISWKLSDFCKYPLYK